HSAGLRRSRGGLLPVALTLQQQGVDGDGQGGDRQDGQDVAAAAQGVQVGTEGGRVVGHRRAPGSGVGCPADGSGAAPGGVGAGPVKGGRRRPRNPAPTRPAPPAPPPPGGRVPGPPPPPPARASTPGRDCPPPTPAGWTVACWRSAAAWPAAANPSAATGGCG